MQRNYNQAFGTRQEPTAQERFLYHIRNSSFRQFVRIVADVYRAHIQQQYDRYSQKISDANTLDIDYVVLRNYDDDFVMKVVYDETDENDDYTYIGQLEGIPLYSGSACLIQVQDDNELVVTIIEDSEYQSPETIKAKRFARVNSSAEVLADFYNEGFNFEQLVRTYKQQLINDRAELTQVRHNLNIEFFYLSREDAVSIVLHPPLINVVPRIDPETLERFLDRITWIFPRDFYINLVVAPDTFDIIGVKKASTIKSNILMYYEDMKDKYDR